MWGECGSGGSQEKKDDVCPFRLHRYVWVPHLERPLALLLQRGSDGLTEDGPHHIQVLLLDAHGLVRLAERAEEDVDFPRVVVEVGDHAFNYLWEDIKRDKSVVVHVRNLCLAVSPPTLEVCATFTLKWRLYYEEDDSDAVEGTTALEVHQSSLPRVKAILDTLFFL